MSTTFLDLIYKIIYDRNACIYCKLTVGKWWNMLKEVDDFECTMLFHQGFELLDKFV